MLSGKEIVLAIFSRLVSVSFLLKIMQMAIRAVNLKDSKYFLSFSLDFKD